MQNPVGGGETEVHVSVCQIVSCLPMDSSIQNPVVLFAT
jgi:hypothetical protein